MCWRGDFSLPCNLPWISAWAKGVPSSRNSALCSIPLCCPVGISHSFLLHTSKGHNATNVQSSQETKHKYKYELSLTIVAALSDPFLFAVQQHWGSCPPELLLFPGSGATRRCGYIWLFIEKSLGTHTAATHTMLPGVYQVHTQCSHLRDTASDVPEPFSTVFQSLLLQHCIYLPALLLRLLQRVTEGVCVSVQCIPVEGCGEAPERGADTWEKIPLDGAGGTGALMWLPVHKSAWLHFQGMYCTYKRTVSSLAPTAAIFPLQPFCPAHR